MVAMILYLNMNDNEDNSLKAKFSKLRVNQNQEITCYSFDVLTIVP